MENARSDLEADGMMYNTKIKSSSAGSEANTMDSFQDGGQQNMNLDRNQSDYSDGPHANSDTNNYPHDSEEHNSDSNEYGKMNDNIPTSQYNSGFNRGNFGMGDQHGGLPNSSSNDFPQQNSHYPHYGQANMRPGYPPASRQGPMPSRPGMGGGNIGMMPPNYNSGQQRVMSGPSLQQQQGGPTPTLNQLLQNSSSQRYPGGYGDYGVSPQKGVNDIANNPGFNQPGNWGQSRPSSGMGYPQMPGNQPYRNQIYDGGSGGRRPPVYPSGQGGGGGQSVAGPYPGQFSPNSRFPSMSNQPNRTPSQPYPQQMPPHYGQQPQQQQSGHPPSSSSPMPYPGGSQSPFMGQSQNDRNNSNSNQAQNSPQPYPSPMSGSQGASPSPRPQPSPSPQHSDKTQHNSNSQDGLTSDESNSGELNAINSNHNRENNSGVTTPTSSSQGVPHPSVSALRPPPSPVGSSGSRSNTPASLSGNQAGSPMPPRPPSAHMEGQNRIQSPMANQGYMPQMMPPPAGMAGNQMPPGYKAGGHPGMMGPGGPNGPPNPGMPPNQMQPGYPQHNSQYPNPPGGQYSNRPGNMGGYGGPGGPNNSYSAAGPMGGSQMYPNNMNPMSRGGPGGYPNSYGPQSGPMNNHYNNYNSQPGMGPGPGGPNMPPNSMHPMNNSMPSVPQSQSPGPPGPKGAQAAAQAAMIAAANSAANRSLFARQQLEQGGQSPGPGQPPNSQESGGQGAPPVSSAEMPPPSSTPSAQPTDSNHRGGPVDENSMSSTCSDDTQPASLKGKESHPATPIAPSPSASQSSVHDDIDNISSPSWPGTPSSHTPLQQKHEGAMRLYDMGDEAERRPFLDCLFAYMEDKGAPIQAMPMISKTPIDLFRLYKEVKERGGLLEVTKTKKWREISTAINVGSSGSAGFTLRKNYIKHLFPYECKFDNGGTDPNPILAQIEAMTQKKESKRPAGTNANQNQNSNNGQSSDPYQPRQQPPYEGYPGQRMPGMASEMQGGPNMMPPPSQGMMPNNMPPHYDNNMMNQNNMPPNTSVMPNSNMMPNSRSMMANNNMMPGNNMANSMSGGQMMPSRAGQPGMMPNSSEGGMNNQSYPEGQGMAPPGQQYSRGYNSGANMQQGNMPNSYPPYNRPANMPPYQQGQQPGGNYQDGMSRAGGPSPNPEQYNNDPYRRNNSNMMPNQQGQPQPPTSTTTPQAEVYNNQPSNYPPSSTSSSSNQYPNYPGTPSSQERSQPGMAADKLLQKLLSKKYDQQAPSPSPTPASGPSQPPNCSSPMLPNSQGPDAANTPPSSSNYSGASGGPPRPYPSPQMMPNRAGDSNYPGNSGPSSGQPYPRPAGYGSQGQDGNFSQSSYPGPSQQPMYAQKPAQPPMPGYQGQKQYPGYQRDGYNMPPAGYPNSSSGQQYGYGQQRPQDSMQPGSMYGGDGGYGSSPFRSPYDSTNNILGGMSDGLSYSPSPLSYSHPTDDFSDMRGSSTTRAADGSWGQRSYPPATGPPATGPQINATSNSSSMTQSMPPTSANVPPYGLYNRVNARMSPMKPEGGKPFTPQKMPTKQSHVNSFPKKEIDFPSGSVEAITPLLHKRKKLNSKDIAPIDPWKMMMALKSGMLAQSTWALDTLTILLYDDNAILYFNMAHLPGLLDALLTHWRHYLIDIFGDEFEELEIQRTEIKEKNKAKRFKSLKEEFEETLGCKVEPTDPQSLDVPGNYTYKTRQGKPVEVVEDECDANYDIKSWDVHEAFESSAMDWKMGRGDNSFHIISQFNTSDTPDLLRKKFYGEERCKIKNSEAAKSVIEKAKSRTETDTETDNKDTDTTESEGAMDVSTEQEIKTEDIKSEVDNEESEEKMDTSSDKENIDQNAGETTLNGPVSIKKERLDSPVPSLLSESQDSKLTDRLSPVIKQELPDAKSITPCIEPDDNAQDAPDAPLIVPNGDVKAEASESGEESKDGSSKPEEEEEFSLPEINHEERRQLFLKALKVNTDTSAAIECLKRKHDNSGEESEAYRRDAPPLNLISDNQEELGQRCVCVSNILRSLSFVPGNDRIMSADRGLLRLLGKLLMLHHTHPKRRKENKTFDKEEDITGDDALDDGKADWWWDTLHALRENALVILANIAGQLNLTRVPEEIVFPLLDSLLHLAVCPSSCAHDPLPSMSANSVLSPQRLVLETMCKLCVTDGNVDLLLATPPFCRTVQLFSRLVNLLADRKEQVLREFSIVLLSSLVRGDSAAARTVALQHPSISLLLDFIETAEHQAMQIAQSHGADMLRDNPEMMGTSLGMLKRAAVALQHMAAVPDNRPLFLKQQDRLLTLVMSHVMDHSITSVLADVLYLCSQDSIFS